MLSYADLDPGKKAFIFELDDVLYPQQDYILQVYYLFANFLEYTETVPPAGDLVEFLKKSYLASGEKGIFEKAAATFGIAEKYKENFDRLHVSAQLPLKLELYPTIANLLQALIQDQKYIYILTKGNPLVQLNKMKHIDWQGSDDKLKVYFKDEIILVSQEEPLVYVIKDNQLNVKDVLLVSNRESDRDIAYDVGVDYLDISLLFD